MIKALEDLCFALEVEMLTQLKANDKNATGSLSRSVNVMQRATPQGYDVVGFANFYAKFVEYGRRAGLKGVPVNALIDWIHAKKIDLRGKNERSAAFAIQRSIRVKGIKPVPFIATALSNKDSMIKATGSRLMIEIKDDVIEKIIQKINGIWQLQ